MKRITLLLATTMGLVVLLAGVALAITHGQPDGNRHPYVGIVVLYDQAGSPLGGCSGTLLSPTVFLTAGHCTVGAASAKVSFDPKITSDPPPTVVTGTPHTHPDYTPYSLGTDRRDVGVVVLDQPVGLGTYGVLPELGFLDKLATQRGKQVQTFTVVGYGVQEVRPTPQEDLERYMGTVSLIDLKSVISDGYQLQYTSNPGLRSPGGTCFGDSGGPTLSADTNVVVGINSRVRNSNCKGTALSYRTDIANTQDFVDNFLQ
jgi:hypothetical protein